MKRLLSILALLSLLTPALMAQYPHFREWGFYGTASYTMMTCFKHYKATHPPVTLNGVQLTGGFQIRRQTCVELGVAFLAHNRNTFTQVPITIGLRTHYLDRRLTPFTELYAGYALPLKKIGSPNDHTTMKVNTMGVTAGLNVGARYTVTRRFCLNLYIGWNLYMTNSYTIYNSDNLPFEEGSWLAHNFRFGLGAMF